MKKYQRIFKEDDSKDTSKKVIKDLIDLKDVKTDEDKATFLGLIKGLVWAKNEHADEFLKRINDFTSTLKIEDFE